MGSGSIDANPGDPQNGWDTDQFPNSVEDLALPLYEILQHGGIARRLQLRRKLRRQKQRRMDLFHAHIGGLDTLAQALLVAADLVERGAWRSSARRATQLERSVGQAILAAASRSSRSTAVASREIDPRPVSGSQELLETSSTSRSGRSTAIGGNRRRSLSPCLRSWARRLDDATRLS